MRNQASIIGAIIAAVLVGVVAVNLVGGSAAETGTLADVAPRSPVVQHADASAGIVAGDAAPDLDPGEWAAAYDDNLALILASDVRNTNHDGSPFVDVPSADLVPADHYGPRTEYLGNPGGNPEHSFPIPEGGQFRAGCEFSHFAYDDPLVSPGRPGAAHLHMFFGNTHVNAFSTYRSLIDSGSSTCNGQELNRTGYWVPAMFDGDGNVRVPERVVVYYKGEGASRGASVPFPDGAALIATEDLNRRDTDIGGAAGKFSFACSDQFSSTAEPLSNTMPNCDGDTFLDLYGVTDEPHVVLEMNVKFPQCWSGESPEDWAGQYAVPLVGNWYGSDCTGDNPINLANLEYFVDYRVDIGETTADWYLSSDIDAATFTMTGEAGSSVHGDWWGGWHEETAQMWIDNCVNFVGDEPSGCGFGYLTDGGPDGENPVDGPALAYRPQYDGPHKIPAETVFAQLCSPLTDRQITRAEEAAYCLPGS